MLKGWGGILEHLVFIKQGILSEYNTQDAVQMVDEHSHSIYRHMNIKCGDDEFNGLTHLHLWAV